MNKITELEKEIYKKLKQIQLLLNKKKKLDYLTMVIYKDCIMFNNEYWNKKKRIDKIELYVEKDVVLWAGGKELSSKCNIKDILENQKEE